MDIYKYFYLSVLLIITYNLSGQVCQGNLGENIFSVGDFGSGTDVFLLQDPMIAPGYTYTTNPPPSDGFYTITNDMGKWNNLYGTWLPLQDRSNDPNGYMMVVNASFSPGIFYQETVPDLCENTLYEFSADIINVVRPGVADHSLPNVTFLLDGDVKYTTGGIPQDGQWKKYGFTFVTGPNQTELELTLRNNAPGGTGNDLALDNFSFRPCGPDAFANAEKEFLICSNDNTPVKVEADTDESAAIQWQFLDPISGIWTDITDANESTIFHTIFDPGTYQYRYLSAGTANNLLNSKCRVISDTATVNVIPIDFILYDTICQNVPYVFGSQELLTAGFYEETFIASNGCDSFVDLFLTIFPEPEILFNVERVDPSCFGFNNGSIVIDSARSGTPPFTYSLLDNQNETGIFTNLNSGIYTLELRDRYQCGESIIINLEDPVAFEVSLGSDTIINLGAVLNFNINTNYTITSGQWAGEFLDCINCIENATRPLENGYFYFRATSEFGCDARDSIFVTLRDVGEQFYKPNIFSPNEDGLNDLFYLQTNTEAITFIPTFKIFDRWGNIMFDSSGNTLSDDSLKWDGRVNGAPAMEGVYTYIMQIMLINGNELTITGNVTLVR